MTLWRRDAFCSGVSFHIAQNNGLPDWVQIESSYLAACYSFADATLSRESGNASQEYEMTEHTRQKVTQRWGISLEQADSKYDELRGP